MTQALKITWDIGTAYDMFISLNVLHEPDRYGLRGAWAAGVRSRLPAAEREILEQMTASFVWPLPWVHTLPAPKDAITVLQSLEQMSPEARLPVLALHPSMPAEWGEILQQVAARRGWDEADLVALQAIYTERRSKRKSKTIRKKLTDILDLWADPMEFGEGMLSALKIYQRVFFEEEEHRIRPVLETALTQAQALAEELPVPDLLAELSQGLHFTELGQLREVVLAPSFWVTPLMVILPLSEGRKLLVYGARPADQSLVPGDPVPDALFQALKALADPTRLRIMRYLSGQPMTPAELSRRLRLRAPTVVHHLHILRLARLVHLTIGPEGRRYAARREAVTAAFALLNSFLGESSVSELEVTEDRE
ncbi:MAG: ArsR family transcriptional regulator [Chloroflexi bacterium]|nr:MAG: ArsR family transcriptional regulator [Chloroflexota bacterium]